MERLRGIAKRETKTEKQIEKEKEVERLIGIEGDIERERWREMEIER